MKVLTVSHFFESHRGGIEIVAGRLAREFARAGIDVVWAATDASPPPDTAGEPRLRTLALPASNVAERSLGVPFPIPAPSSFAGIVREVAAADVVLVHDALYLTSVATCLVARWNRKPVVVVQHIGAVPYKNPVLRGMMALANRVIARPLLARTDQTVFISATTARYFDGLSFRSQPKLIFNGVDADVFSPPATADAIETARRQFGLPLDRPVALFVGRFVEKKGLAVLERLAAARPDVEFAFAGWGPLDPRGWRRANVHVFDTLTGPTLASLYRAADVFVLPSTGEGFPLVVQEALACGLPVICGDETVRADDGASAMLAGVPVDPTNPDRTAEHCGRVLASCLARPGDAAARAALAAQRYSWPRAAARYIDVMKRLHDAAGATDAEPTSVRVPIVHNRPER
jgi:glycosyltransferase involved in cell wall biosynthesis